MNSTPSFSHVNLLLGFHELSDLLLDVHEPSTTLFQTPPVDPPPFLPTPTSLAPKTHRRSPFCSLTPLPPLSCAPPSTRPFLARGERIRPPGLEDILDRPFGLGR